MPRKCPAGTPLRIFLVEKFEAGGHEESGKQVTLKRGAALDVISRKTSTSIREKHGRLESLPSSCSFQAHCPALIQAHFFACRRKARKIQSLHQDAFGKRPAIRKRV
jgi:hypothetical protein